MIPLTPAEVVKAAQTLGVVVSVGFPNSSSQERTIDEWLTINDIYHFMDAPYLSGARLCFNYDNGASLTFKF